MKQKSITMTFPPSTSEELRRIAKELGIPETEVLRKGLEMMILYAKIKTEREKGEKGKPLNLLFQDEQGIHELRVV